DYPSNVVFVTRLSGYELARFPNALYCAPGRNPLYSEHSQWIPQYAVEEVMRAHAQSLAGVDIRFNCELASFEQDRREVRAIIRRSTRIDLPYEVLSSDEWVASRLLATHYRDRRVFLAGDACHLHPPFGGYGMNMGIADGVDLGWKIAAVLQGWGGAKLLDSYEPERRPVHNFVMDEAVANHSTLANDLKRDGIEDATDEGAAIRRDVGVRIQ